MIFATAILVHLVAYVGRTGRDFLRLAAGNKPPPVAVNIAEAKSEVIPNLLTAVGDLAAVHQVNVTSDVNGRITQILFTAGASVKAGTPLVQVMPFRREPWQSVHAAWDDAYASEVEREQHANLHLYKEKYWRKKTYG